jgi:hypothetical protein
MKGAGLMTSGMAKALRGILMIILTLGSLRLAKRMDKESTLGPMGKSLMASGTKDLSMAMASGKGSKMTPTLESGANPKLMDSGSIHGLMVTNTRVNGICALSMEPEQIHFRLAMSTLVSIKKASLTGRAHTHGLLVNHIQATSKMVKSREKGSGSLRAKTHARYTRETLTTIRSMAKASSPGPAVTFTKATTWRMRGTDTVR